VGNRLSRVAIVGGTTTTDVTTLDAGSNQLESITTNGSTSRTFTHNGAGYLKTDAKGGVTTTYTYYHSGRLSNVNVGGSGRGPYRYNAFARLVSRQVTSGVPASTIHMVYDEAGNLIAEADATTGLVMREYAWIDSRPLAAWKDVDTAGPIRYHVHVDHLDRPVMMTNVYKAIVWRAVYKPFGEVHSITGPAAIDYRFPGQWFMLETGLHYNWRRWYDASLGRYTQPDLFGLVDGPSRYAYALNSPLVYVDPTGELAWWVIPAAFAAGNFAWQLYQNRGNVWCVDPFEVAGWALTGLPALRAGWQGAGIYDFLAASGLRYVGQGQNVATRLAQHSASGKLPRANIIGAHTKEVLGGRTAREIAEQLRINQLGGVKHLENIRNPIGRSRHHLLPPE
jgi:RHS repeat-associated protein